MSATATATEPRAEDGVVKKDEQKPTCKRKKIGKVEGAKTQYTVKCRVKPKTAALQEWIEHGVDIVTEMAIHASRFINIYLLHCIENGLPFPVTNKTFFSNVFQLLRSVNEKGVVTQGKNAQKSAKRKEKKAAKGKEKKSTNSTSSSSMSTNSTSSTSMSTNSTSENAIDTDKGAHVAINAEQQMQNAFNTLYRTLLPTTFRIDQTAADLEFLDRLAADMQNTLRVYLRTQFLTRFRAWCKDTVCDIIPIDTTGRKTLERTARLKERATVVAYLFGQTACSDSNVLDVDVLTAETSASLATPCAHVWTEEVARCLSSAIAETRRFFSMSITYTHKVDGQEVTETAYCRPITFSKLKDVRFSAIYLRWMALRLKQIEQHNRDAALNTALKQKKTFSIVPISSLDRKYVSVESVTLRRFIHRNRDNERAVGKEIYAFLRGKKIENISDMVALFEKRPLWFWHRCFKIDTKLGKDRQFDLRLTTDGVGCSLSYIKLGERRKTRAEEKAEKNGLITLEDDEQPSSDRKIRVFSAEMLEQSDILGVDPGRNDLYTSVIANNAEDDQLEWVDELLGCSSSTETDDAKEEGEGLEEDAGDELSPSQLAMLVDEYDRHETPKNHVESYSRAKWQVACGGKAAQKKREKWVKGANKNYEYWLLNMPSCKVSSVGAMQQHVLYLMHGLALHLYENGKHRVRNLRFTNYVKHQKALAKMVNEFINAPKRAIGSTKEHTIVAFGDAEFKTSGPVNKMKQELRRRKNVTLVDIDEFRTSKMTTCCAFPHGDEEREQGEQTEPIAVERVGPMVDVVKKREKQRKRLFYNGPKEEKTEEDEKKRKEEEKEEYKTRVVRRERSYRVTICQNCSCIWNRDVNAALNMLRIFLYAQRHRGARHPVFRRTAAKCACVFTAFGASGAAACSSSSSSTKSDDEDVQEAEDEEEKRRKRVCRNEPEAARTLQ